MGTCQAGVKDWLQVPGKSLLRQARNQRSLLWPDHYDWIWEIISCCNLTFYILEPVFNWKITTQSLIYFLSVCLSLTTPDFSLSLSDMKQQDQNLIFSLWHSNISQAANCQTILCHFSKFLCFYLFMFCNYAFCWTPYSKLIFPLGTIKSWSWALLVIPWVLHSWS